MSRSSNARFWTYWGASTTSRLGSAVTALALPLIAVLTLHASTMQLGVLTAAAEIAWLVVGMPAGALVRHWPLRRTQVSLDLARAVAIGSIPLAWPLGHLTYAQLVIVALVISFADVFFDVANSTFLPRVVPREELHSRNSLMSATDAVTQLGGPSLGGVLVAAFGAASALVVDSVSYLTSAFLLARLPEHRDAEPDAVRASLREQIREGWLFVTRQPIMNACMWDATVTNFVCGIQMALFPVYLVRTLHAPTTIVGVLLAAEGIGSLVGASASPRIVRALGSARACLLAGVVATVGALVVPLGADRVGWAFFALGTGIFAFGVVIMSIATRTYRQTATPPELLSRVMATVRFVSWGAIPLGGLFGGFLAGQLGIRETILLAAIISALSPLILLASPVRHLRNLDDYEPTTNAPLANPGDDPTR